MARKDNGKLKELIAEYGIKDMNDVREFVKMLTAETIQAALDAELDSELGYSKYDYKNKQTSNSRNGHSVKTVQGSMGDVVNLIIYHVLQSVNEKMFQSSKNLLINDSMGM